MIGDLDFQFRYLLNTNSAIEAKAGRDSNINDTAIFKYLFYIISGIFGVFASVFIFLIGWAFKAILGFIKNNSQRFGDVISILKNKNKGEKNV